jgi:HSP20 family molecular chaperone IbpA
MSTRQPRTGSAPIGCWNGGRARWHRESRPENFRRSFELDPSIDAGKISAKIEQGVVTLTLPKAEQVKPRKIAIS